MGNKNRFSGISSQESKQSTMEGEQTMSEHDQNVEAQTKVQQHAEELQVHGETGQGEGQQEQPMQESSVEQEEGSHRQEPGLEGDKQERPPTIDDIVKPGKFGVTNSQMIPALKQALLEGSIEKLQLLRSTYLYSFENSLRYLKKKEREFIQSNLN